MSDTLGYSLVSQQIRRLMTDGFLRVPEQDLSKHEVDIPTQNIKRGYFVDGGLEGRVQPGSFEPSLADEIFILDARDQGILRPRRDESVYRTLLQIPMRGRTRKNISGGFEVKTGFTYLVKLNESISPTNSGDGVNYIRSSPKSSNGRLFPRTRFLVDYCPGFDEVYRFSAGGVMDMWLLVQPTKFNLVLWPGLSLNQLRFFSGDAKLSDDELRKESRENPLLYGKTADGELVPIELEYEAILDGLRLNLDVSGNNTHGVFGLRARNNPDPIDLSKTEFYSAEDYFEPMLSKGKNSLRRGEHYLLNSQEVLRVPAHLSAELRKHSRQGIEGRTHDAGFVDEGFSGDVVFEVVPDEKEDMVIEQGTPFSSLDFFRTSENPDKVYGEDIGSNYQGQTGPRISKHFIDFDFEKAARNHEKLSRIVLVEDARVFRDFRYFSEGFEPINESNANGLLEVLNHGFFHSRYDCEDDELIRQAIPYTIVFNDEGDVFSYVRTQDKKEYGDKRLLGKHSIGLGGHVTKEDAPNHITRCLEREVTEEEVKFMGERSEPKLVGTLFARDKPVDRVHFGLIYTIHTTGAVTPNEASIAHAEFVPIDKVEVGFMGAETETWSRILIPYLEPIYKMSKA